MRTLSAARHQAVRTIYGRVISWRRVEGVPSQRGFGKFDDVFVAMRNGALNQRVQQLGADHDSQRVLLAEVSQHLPPAQRFDTLAKIAKIKAALARIRSAGRCL